MSSVDIGPGVDDGDDLTGWKVGQGEIMRRGEGKDVAFSSDGLGLQEARLEF